MRLPIAKGHVNLHNQVDRCDLVKTTYLSDKSACKAGNSFAKSHLTVVMLSVETIFLKVLSYAILSYANLLGPGAATF